MDLKLQQAIVATRAGRSDVAQSLLTQLIAEKPDDANAWFLLGHIVGSRDRQIRYLQKAVELDPDNPIAKKQFAQLTAPQVPAPVIAQDELAAAAFETEEKKPLANQDPTQTTPIDTTKSEAHDQGPSGEVLGLPRYQDNQNVVPQQTPENKGNEPSSPSGTPKRESKPTTRSAQILHIPQDSSHAISSSDRTPEEVWLLRILAIMVVLAVIVLGFLVLLILF